MDVLTSGIAIAGEVMNGFWTFATSNIFIMITLILSLVGAGIGLFFSLKSRLGGKKKGGKRGGRK